MIQTPTGHPRGTYIRPENTYYPGSSKLNSDWWRPTAILVIAASSLLPSCAGAAPTGDNQFNVTVEPSSSQRQVVVQGAAAIAASTVQLRALQRIIDDLGDVSEYVDNSNKGPSRTSSFALRIAGLSLVSSSQSVADVAFGRWNTFSNVQYSFGDHNGTVNTPAHDVSTAGVLAGADYRVTPDFVIGFALGYLKSDNDYDIGLGRMELEGYNLSALGTWYVQPAWYVDGIARIGWNAYDMRRATANDIARGESDGAQFTLSVGSGYEFHSGPLTIGPRVRLKYTKANISSYREHGLGALVYDDQDIESLTSHLGIEATYAINTDFGVFVPQLNLEWTHEFKNEPDSIAAHPAAGGPRFLIPTDRRDDNFFHASLGVSTILPGGKILYLLYETVVSRKNRDRHTITLGVRIEL